MEIRKVSSNQEKIRPVNDKKSIPINQIGIQGKNIEINADNVYIINNNYNQPVHYSNFNYNNNYNYNYFQGNVFGYYYFPFLYYPTFWMYCFPSFPIFSIVYPFMGVIL